MNVKKKYNVHELLWAVYSYCLSNQNPVIIYSTTRYTKQILSIKYIVIYSNTLAAILSYSPPSLIILYCNNLWRNTFFPLLHPWTATSYKNSPHCKLVWNSQHTLDPAIADTEIKLHSSKSNTALFAYLRKSSIFRTARILSQGKSNRKIQPQNLHTILLSCNDFFSSPILPHKTMTCK